MPPAAQRRAEGLSVGLRRASRNNKQTGIIKQDNAKALISHRNIVGDEAQEATSKTRCSCLCVLKVRIQFKSVSSLPFVVFQPKVKRTALNCFADMIPLMTKVGFIVLCVPDLVIFSLSSAHFDLFCVQLTVTESRLRTRMCAQFKAVRNED